MTRRAFVLAVVLVLPGCLGVEFLHGVRQEKVEFAGGVPVLRWEAFPSERDLEADEQGLLSRARDVRYEVRVYRAEDGELAYERRGVHDTELSLPFPFEAGHYHWTVRPWFTLDGRPRVGQWSFDSKGPWRNAELPVPVDHYPAFVVKQ